MPDIPARIPVISIADIKLTKTRNLFDLVEDMTPVENDTVMTFEALNQGHGYVLYRRHFNQPISGMLKAEGIADFGVVYVGGEKVGELNRLTGKDSLEVNVPFNSTLEILVENLGRINYGSRITENNKGLTRPNPNTTPGFGGSQPKAAPAEGTATPAEGTAAPAEGATPAAPAQPAK